MAGAMITLRASIGACGAVRAVAPDSFTAAELAGIPGHVR
jgi:hypothetical protein